MTAFLSDRLSGGIRAALFGLLLALLLLPAAASTAAQRAGGDARELWATQTGDDPRGSRPGFDDAAWPRVAVRSSWREQGHQAYDGVVWFRRAVALGEEARLAGRRNELGLLLGPPAY